MSMYEPKLREPEGPAWRERMALRYVATAIAPEDRYRFLHADHTKGQWPIEVVDMAARALRQAAWAGQTIRLKWLMRVLTPEEHGPQALAQAVMADHPLAVAQLLQWGMPVVKGDLAWSQAHSEGNPAVVQLVEAAAARAAPAPETPAPSARRSRRP